MRSRWPVTAHCLIRAYLYLGDYCTVVLANFHGMETTNKHSLNSLAVSATSLKFVSQKLHVSTKDFYVLNEFEGMLDNYNL